jgi:hypothetical protein
LDDRGVVSNQAHGCVYPPEVHTIAEQIEHTNKITWRAYMEDMGNAAKVTTVQHPHSESGTCRYPDELGDLDCTNQARRYDTNSGPIYDQYTTRHNPFVYFQSITDDQNTCDQHDVPLDRLKADLNSGAATPNLVFISPNLCHDGHDGGNEATKDELNLPRVVTKVGTRVIRKTILETSCPYKYPKQHDRKCVDGQLGNLNGIDWFLAEWIPIIINSAAYKKDGMIIVTFDEAETTDRRASKSQAEGGGGLVGALVISNYVIPKNDDQTPYNHYALLRSIEEQFGLQPLGLAAEATSFSHAPDGFYKTAVSSSPTP